MAFIAEVGVSCADHMAFIAEVGVSCADHMTFIAEVGVSCADHMTFIAGVGVSCADHVNNDMPEVDSFSCECYQTLSSPRLTRREPGNEGERSSAPHTHLCKDVRSNNSKVVMSSKVRVKHTPS